MFKDGHLTRYGQTVFFVVLIAPVIIYMAGRGDGMTSVIALYGGATAAMLAMLKSQLHQSRQLKRIEDKADKVHKANAGDEIAHFQRAFNLAIVQLTEDNQRLLAELRKEK